MKNLLILFSLFFASNVFGQETHYTVTGKVIDKNTKAPLLGASVFAQNTTFGIATDAEGNFKLKVPNGGYVLVVSFSGYETESMRISNSIADQGSIVIEVRPREKSMAEVSIVATSEVKDGWQKFGQFFTDNFIGSSEFSKQATIKNPEVLKFYFSKKKNRLKVIAADPVIVTNQALGYIIKFAIDSFSYEYNTNNSQFIGYPLFEEMHGTAEQEAQWKSNRAKAYNGSMLHFMRSLYNKTLESEGFEIQFMVKTNDNEHTIPVNNIYAALNYDKDDSTKTVAFYPNQPDIVVIYKKAKPEQGFLDFDPKANKNFQASILTISDDEVIVIEQNGYYFDQINITVNGYLAYEKVGNMLPFDYFNF